MERRRVLSSGFTLLEIAIVLLIGGLMIGAAATMVLNYIREMQMVTTQNRMQEIDNAIVQYLNVNGVLPCPASLTTKQDSSLIFARSITDLLAPAADCYNSAGAGGTFKTKAGRANAGIAPSPPGAIVMGAVPVRSLGLPEEDFADAWGDRFIYAVTDQLTYKNSYDPTQGAIFVVDSAGVNLTAPAGSAQYVIVSYGANRAGAYTLAGVKSGTLCPGPAAALEKTNCTYATATFRQTTLNSNKTGNGMFDDYVTYHTQIDSGSIVPAGTIGQFDKATQGPNCPSGWTTYAAGGDACTAGADYLCCQKY